MSSFVKLNSKRKLLTGLPLVDRVLGEIIPGTMILIEEDEFSYLHNVLLNSFISEGDDKENLMVVGESLNNFNVYGRNEGLQVEQGIQKMHIAWRYTDLKLDQMDYKFDLVKKAEFKGEKLEGLSIEKLCERLSQIKNTRIAVYSLFSPFYDARDAERHLFLIKKAVRENNNLCMVSIPTFLHHNINFNLFFDATITIVSNLMTGLLPNYRATIEFKKLSTYQNIRPRDLDTYIYGVKFIKNKLVMENIDLPPDETVPSIGCTSF